MADTKTMIEEMRSGALEAYADHADGVAGDLESPIEELLYWALLGSSNAWDPAKVHWGQNDRAASWFAISAKFGRVSFYPQYTIEACGERYRLDFLAESFRLRFAIECDGHDFHERTKEQAARDRKRDRNLQSAGLTVLRFTGSEIHKDPMSVAAELLGAIETQVRRNLGDDPGEG